MGEMVEQVAKGMARQRGVPWLEHWRDLIPDARAAIEAMREPTEAMDAAMQEAADYAPYSDRVWRAGIDAALGD
jgi:hypothetical protein